MIKLISITILSLIFLLLISLFNIVGHFFGQRVENIVIPILYTIFLLCMLFIFSKIINKNNSGNNNNS